MPEYQTKLSERIGGWDGIKACVCMIGKAAKNRPWTSSAIIAKRLGHHLLDVFFLQTGSLPGVDHFQ